MRAQNELDGFMEIWVRHRLDGLLQQFDVPIDEFSQNIFFATELGKGFLHAVCGAQLAAHLALNIPLELGKTLIAQTLGEAHDSRVAHADSLGELVDVGVEQRSAVVLQVVSESSLGAVERADLGQNLFDRRHETFISNIVMKLSCTCALTFFSAR